MTCKHCVVLARTIIYISLKEHAIKDLINIINDYYGEYKPPSKHQIISQNSTKTTTTQKLKEIISLGVSSYCKYSVTFSSNVNVNNGVIYILGDDDPIYSVSTNSQGWIPMNHTSIITGVSKIKVCISALKGGNVSIKDIQLSTFEL